MSEQKFRQYECPKCGGHLFDTEPIHTTGGTVSRMFNYQNKRFLAVTCRHCGYTELYRETSSTGSDILDLFFG